jgi:mRNA-degrading endonuclease toxin of MazEF toxin-antitoxin module
MKKDFNLWNERKKFIHNELGILPYRERQIWWCSLGVNIGSEEDGNGERAERPAVIIRGFSRELCWVVPLSSQQKENPYYLQVGIIDEKAASAMISQMKPLDTRRLINCLGIMDLETFTRLRKAIKDLL